MSTEIQWEEPPERTRRVERPGKYDAVKAALKEHPGRSAMVFHGKTANTSWWKRQGFEATSRTQEDGTVKTYVCWPVGKDPADETPVKRVQRRPAAKRPARPATAVTDEAQEVPVVVKPAPKAPAKQRPAKKPAQESPAQAAAADAPAADAPAADAPAAEETGAATKRKVVPLVAQHPRPARAGAVQKDPNGALAAGGETTGTCTECKRPRRPIGQQDRICRTCRLNHATRKAL